MFLLVSLLEIEVHLLLSLVFHHSRIHLGREIVFSIIRDLI